MLEKIPFSEGLLAEVQDFDCGDDEWDLPLNHWIKAPPDDPTGALFDLSKSNDLKVWLHYNQKGRLVGYSSLGESKWRYPTKKAKPRIISIIPNVAIHREYHGEPRGDPPRYSDQIMDHLIFEARLEPSRAPHLGLFVDPRNKEAIKFYDRRLFKPYWRVYSQQGVEYVSRILDLEGPLLE